MYRIYVTDTIKVISETLANVYGGKSPKFRYAEIIEGSKQLDQGDNRTAQEIASSIKHKLNGLTGG